MFLRKLLTHLRLRGSHSTTDEAAGSPEVTRHPERPTIQPFLAYSGSDMPPTLGYTTLVHLRHLTWFATELVGAVGADSRSGVCPQIGGALRGWGQPSANGLTTAGGVRVDVCFHDTAPGPPQVSGTAVAAEHLLAAYCHSGCGRSIVCFYFVSFCCGSRLINIAWSLVLKSLCCEAHPGQCALILAPCTLPRGELLIFVLSGP